MQKCWTIELSDYRYAPFFFTSETYGVPLGPLAISSFAFLFKNKNARFSCVKFTGFKKREARKCESARTRERDRDSEG